MSSYFSLRKQAPEPEPEPVEEDATEAEEELPAEEPPATPRGPVLTGLLGPGAWLAARFGTGAAWTVHIVAVWAVGFYGGWVAVGVPAAWLGMVLAFVPRDAKDRTAAWIEHRLATRPHVEEGAGAPPIVAVMWTLIGDAPGVHLKALTAALQKAAPEGTEEGVDKAAVRRKLAALGIPTKGSVRDAAGRVNEGVHRADLQAWEKALPAPSPDTPAEARSDPGSDALTSGVAGRRRRAATPLSRLRGVLPRGVS